MYKRQEVELNDKLESKYKGLYIIGDGSGVTHSLSHASASGVYAVSYTHLIYSKIIKCPVCMILSDLIYKCHIIIQPATGLHNSLVLSVVYIRCV